MQIVEVKSKVVRGLGCRTKNSVEMNPATSRIAALVQRFDQEIVPDYRNGGRVYTVYHDYESDASGEFSVLIGCDLIQSATTEVLEEVTIPAGKYLVFAASGEMPQIVIETWQKIWAWFDHPDAACVRRFTTDFEFYNSASDIQIHIAVADKPEPVIP